MGRQRYATPEEYARIRDYVIGKANRYRQPKVTVSDRMLEKIIGEQRIQLIRDVADAGYILDIKEHNYGASLYSTIAESNVPRFGAGKFGEDRVHRSRNSDGD